MDLYKTDKYNFSNLKGRCGWYNYYHREECLCLENDVIAWKKLDKPMQTVIVKEDK